MCQIDWQLLAAMITALGTVGIAIGTVMAGIGAIKLVPKAIKDNTRTIDEARERYRTMLLRMIARTEAEYMSLDGRTGFPANFDTWLPLLVEKFPVIGDADDAKEGVTDLMEAGRLTYVTQVKDGPPYLVTIKWDKKGRRKDMRQELNQNGENIDP